MFRIINAHVLAGLAEIPDESVHCCVTSPPYYGLRAYGTDPQVWGGDGGCVHEWGDEQIRRGPAGVRGSTSQRIGRADEEQQRHAGKPQGYWCQLCGAWRGELGSEPDYRLYIEHLVQVFREVRRVLRPDGTLWLNLGDSYATGAGKVGDCPGGGRQGARWAGPHPGRMKQNSLATNSGAAIGPAIQMNRLPQPGLKPKDLMMIPARVAIALQEDGWWLRADNIWAKRNCMPESVRDRTTKSHEYVFHFAKSESYYYDADAIAEPLATAEGENYPARARVTGRGDQGFAAARGNDRGKSGGFPPVKRSGNKERKLSVETRPNDHRGSSIPWEGFERNKRSVWFINTRPFKGAHFAVMPEELADTCVLAGCPPGGTVLDPFSGAATVGVVAARTGRDYIGLELNPKYLRLGYRRYARASMFHRTPEGIDEPHTDLPLFQMEAS